MDAYLPPPGCFSDRCNNVGIARAATQVATHALANLCWGQILNCEWLRDVLGRRTRPARCRFFDHCDGRHDLARSTEAALKPVMLNKHVLDCVQAAVALQSFDRRD